MSRRRLRLLLAAPLLAAGLAACSSSSLAADDVANGAEDALEAEVGAETRCTLTVDGDDQEYGVTVTVTSVEGETANFDVQVDEDPVG